MSLVRAAMSESIVEQPTPETKRILTTLSHGSLVSLPSPLLRLVTIFLSPDAVAELDCVSKTLRPVSITYFQRLTTLSARSKSALPLALRYCESLRHLDLEHSHLRLASERLAKQLDLPTRDPMVCLIRRNQRTLLTVQGSLSVAAHSELTACTQLQEVPERWSSVFRGWHRAIDGDTPERSDDFAARLAAVVRACSVTRLALVKYPGGVVSGDMACSLIACTLSVPPAFIDSCCCSAAAEGSAPAIGLHRGRSRCGCALHDAEHAH